RKTMQHGANRATPPAKKAASTEPVVSRSPMAALRAGVRGFAHVAEAADQDPLQLAAREASVAEEGVIDEDERAHRRPMPRHQFLPVGAAGVHGGDREGEAGGEVCECLVCVFAE